MPRKNTSLQSYKLRFPKTKKHDTTIPKNDKLEEFEQQVTNLSDPTLYDELERGFCFVNRTIYLPVTIEAGDAQIFMAKARLIYSLSEPNESEEIEPITILTGCRGGDIYESLAIIDFIRASSPKVKFNTIGYGLIASAGSVIFTSCTGNRSLSKHSQIMFHNVSNEVDSPTNLVRINQQKKTFDSLNNTLATIMSNYTKKDLSYWLQYLEDEKDVYFSAQECIEMGIADNILDSI